MSQFSDWIDKELERRRWNRAELSRRSGISQAGLSHIWKGDRNPGKDMCKAIAQALGRPPEEVFRAAGILDDLPPEDAEAEAWRHRLRKLPKVERDRFARMIDLLNEDNEAEQREREEAARIINRKKTGPLPEIHQV